MPVGQKRNYGVEQCRYDFIVHQDDDDYYFPDSILAKVRILKRYPKCGCCFSNLLSQLCKYILVTIFVVYCFRIKYIVNLVVMDNLFLLPVLLSEGKDRNCLRAPSAVSLTGKVHACPGPDADHTMLLWSFCGLILLQVFLVLS